MTPRRETLTSLKQAAAIALLGGSMLASGCSSQQPASVATPAAPATQATTTTTATTAPGSPAAATPGEAAPPVTENAAGTPENAGATVNVQGPGGNSVQVQTDASGNAVQVNASTAAGNNAQVQVQGGSGTVNVTQPGSSASVNIKPGEVNVQGAGGGTVNVKPGEVNVQGPGGTSIKVQGGADGTVKVEGSGIDIKVQATPAPGGQ